MIEVERRDLLAAMALAARGAERWARVPILAALHCRANGKLELTGTDLDSSITARVRYTGDASAPFLIGDHRFLHHALKHGGGDLVTITEPGERVTCQSGALAVTDACEADPDNFPLAECAVGDEAWSATLSAEHLAQIARLFAAISTEETRYYLNGVYFHHVEGWTYRAAATDGHRLMEVELALPDAEGDLAPIIIPRRTITQWRAFGKAGDGVRVRVGPRRIANAETTTAPEPTVAASRIEAQGTVGAVALTIGSKLIDGSYPDYRRAIPKECSFSALFGLAELRRAIAAMTVGKRSICPALKFSMRDASGATIEKMYGGSASKARFGIEAREAHVPEGGFEIGLNGRYLSELLAALKGDEVMLGFGPMQHVHSEPVLIADPAETGFVAVLMPMRV